MPPAQQRRPPTSNETAVCFANVSVVRMASAASAPSRCPEPRRPRRSRPAPRSTGSGTPMTPVEQTSTSSSAQPSASAAACAIAFASASALRPGARVRVAGVDDDGPAPCPRRCGGATRATGAAATWFVVNSGRRTDRLVGAHEREVAPTFRLEPAVHARRREALGGDHAAVGRRERCRCRLLPHAHTTGDGPVETLGLGKAEHRVEALDRLGPPSPCRDCRWRTRRRAWKYARRRARPMLARLVFLTSAVDGITPASCTCTNGSASIAGTVRLDHLLGREAGTPRRDRRSRAARATSARGAARRRR